MRKWVASFFSRRQNADSSRLNTRRGKHLPQFDALEDRLAPAIVPLAANGEGYNMPRYPIESEVRSALNVPWTPLSITVSSPPSGAVNHNVALNGQISLVNTGQVSLEVQTDGGAFAPLGLSGSTFSFSSALALNGSGDGPHSFTFRATDQSARTATTTVSFRLDTIAPTVSAFDLDTASDTTPTGDHTSTLASITLQGTAEANSTVFLINTGASTTADATGRFSFANVALATGATTFSVRATDAAGNQGTTLSRTVTRGTSSANPSVTINPLVSNSATPTLTGTVDDPAATVSVSVNGQAINATVTGTTWSAVVGTALASGAYSVTTTATNAASNTGTATLATGLTIDLAPPTVAITSTTTSPTNAGSVTVTIAFSEVVTGFTAADLSVVNGSISNLASTDSKTYTATLTPSANGLVTVNLAAGAAFDAANNGNTAAAPYTITFDTAPPTVAITTTASDPTSLTSIPITLTFNESVLGFTQSGVNITNGTISNFVAVNETTYTFSIIPAASGLVTVRVLASSAHDAANNNNAETTFSITSNLVVPTVTITSSETSPTKAASIPVTVTFSEDVTGFTASSFTIANGTASGFVAVNGRSYTFSIVPTGDGAVTVNVAAGVAQSVSSSTGNAAGSFSITSDRTAPSAAITSSAASPTNLAAIPITIEFSEDVIGFTAAGLTATGGTIGDFVAVDGNTYTATITPTGDGAVTVNVLAAAAHDAANNNNSASAAFSVTSDRTAPMATITSSATSPTNLALIPITVTFTEDVADFTAADVVVTNGAIGIITAVDGHTYTFSITPTADGPVTVQLAAGVVHDAAGNGNPVANFTINADVPPTASIATAANPTNAATIAMTVTFSEDVTDFSAAGVTVANGTLNSLTPIDGHTYTLVITPTADGAVVVNILAGAGKDSGGNLSTAATLSVTSDRTAPTATIASALSSPTNQPTIPITIEFSENVIGFTAANVAVTNGTLSGFVAIDGNSYTATITPTGDGVMSVAIAAAAVQDAAGNANTAANFSITSDTTVPTATITSSVAGPTSQTAIPITIEFSEDVVDFTEANITLLNGSLSNFVAVDGNTYTATLTPTADGAVSVSILAAVAHDAAGNANTAATFSIVSDTAPPTVTIATTLTGPTNAATIPITIVFDEDVTGFTESDIVVGNGTLANFTFAGGRTYTANVTPLADGAVTIDIAAGSAQDAAGTDNLAATFSIVFDATVPTVAITTSAADPMHQASFPITLTFSEDVAGLTAAGISVANGSLSLLTKVNDQTYTATITPLADGLVTIEVAAGAAHDAAGNVSTGASFSITADIPPIAGISTSSGSSTNTSPIPITITFSEDVTGFSAAGISLTNGSLDDFVAVDGDTYTFTVTPTVDGLVTIDVLAGAGLDSGGNGNAAATLSLTFDSAAPTVSISTAASDPTNLTTIPFTISFDQDVVDFTQAGVVVGNGTISSFTPIDGRTYNIAVTPTASGLVTVTIPAAAAHDSAGNGNVAAASLALLFDGTPPSVSLTSLQSGPTNAASVSVTIAFSEDVFDFSAADLLAVNGVASDFLRIDDRTYTVTLTPSADGAVTLAVNAGVAHDLAGNGNTLGQFTIIADKTAPHAVVSSTAADPTNLVAIPFTVTFDEDVVNFSAAGVMVTNGTLSGFLAVNNRTYTFTVTPTADGLVTINVLAAAAQDAVGNNNAAATFALTSDLTIPTMAITSTASNPTNLATIPITIEFSEDVLDFSVANVNVTNGSLSDFVAVNGHTYTVKVAPALNGLVTVSVAAAAAHDAAGNTSTAGAFSITADRMAPSAAITSTVGAATDTASFPVSIVFNEDVTSFAAANVNVTNGVLSDFTKTDDHTYTATVTATAPGLVVVAIPAAVVQDGAGNDNAASSLSVNYDAAAPTVKSIIGNFSATSADANATTLLSGIFDDNSIGSSSVTFKILKGATAVDATLNLFDKDAPLTVANFLNYLDRYAAQGGTVFHRLHLENGLEIIQGGGYTFNASTVMLDQINSDAPIANEYSDVHQNTNGTIAMARTSDPNSATSEFFFNFKDTNASTLNASNSGGYAVFGVAATPADLAVIESLASIPIKNFGGALAEFPLLDGATVDTNNIIRVQQIVVNHRDDALTYSATSSNTSAATVALSGFQNNQLTLDYLAAGTTTITITATDKAGNAASTSFVVTVT